MTDDSLTKHFCKQHSLSIEVLSWYGSLQSPLSACRITLFAVKLDSGKVSQADEDLGGYFSRYHTTNSSMRTGPRKQSIINNEEKHVSFKNI